VGKRPVCPSRTLLRGIHAVLWGVWANVLFAPPALCCGASVRRFGARGQSSMFAPPAAYQFIVIVIIFGYFEMPEI